MRLIDSDAVIKAIDKHTFDTDDGLCLDDDITCILEEVPTIEDRKWIPCSERLPDERGEYIVTNYDGYAYETTWDDWDGRKWLSDKVAAWMPLPEPYGGM